MVNTKHLHQYEIGQCQNRKIDINILDNLISNFIIKEEKVVNLEINKN
jgi:hypothetical protein